VFRLVCPAHGVNRYAVAAVAALPGSTAPADGTGSDVASFLVVAVAFLLLIWSIRLFRPMFVVAAEMVKMALRAAIGALLVTGALVLLILSLVLRWH